MGALGIELREEVEGGVDGAKHRWRQIFRLNHPGAAIDQIVAQNV